MFKCEKCGRVTEPGEKMSRLPDKVRRVEYHTTVNYLEGKPLSVISHGYEPISEIELCPWCARAWRPTPVAEDAKIVKSEQFVG